MRYTGSGVNEFKAQFCHFQSKDAVQPLQASRESSNCVMWFCEYEKDDVRTGFSIVPLTL